MDWYVYENIDILQIMKFANIPMLIRCFKSAD